MTRIAVAADILAQVESLNDERTSSHDPAPALQQDDVEAFVNWYVQRVEAYLQG